MVARMTPYSAEAQRRAHRLAAHAAENLRRFGKSVYFDPGEGRYVVVDVDGEVDAGWVRVADAPDAWALRRARLRRRLGR
ncbi:hypothetical protein AES38_13855 [Clavibacter capsici]|nr:hypothetical protein AES38_13855 [Clavibacter capsici]